MTPSNTTIKCAKYHKIMHGDTCQAIEHANGISPDTMRRMNQQLNADCSNLMLGFNYCVKPGKAAVSTTLLWQSLNYIRTSASPIKVPETTVTLDTTITESTTDSQGMWSLETTAVDTTATVPEVHFATMAVTEANGQVTQSAGLEADHTTTAAKRYVRMVS